MSKKRFSYNDGINFLVDGWDNFLFSASSCGLIMQDARGDSNLVKYNKAKDALIKKRIEYSELDNKETKKALTLKKQIDDLKIKRDNLEPIKDIPNLSDTTKTHLADLYTVYTTGRTEDIASKYMEKGTMIEEDIITNYSLLRNRFFKKNTVRKKNEFVEGEMDFPDDEEDMILDAKGNWTIFQFNRAKVRPIKANYHWQLDCYMWLWNKTKGRLVYGLVNTPQQKKKKEKKNLLWTFTGTDEEYKEACDEIEFLHKYDDLPIERKIKIFDVERSDERIEKIKQRVSECRYYLNNFEKADKIFEDETED